VRVCVREKETLYLYVFECADVCALMQCGDYENSKVDETKQTDMANMYLSVFFFF